MTATTFEWISAAERAEVAEVILGEVAQAYKAYRRERELFGKASEPVVDSGYLLDYLKQHRAGRPFLTMTSRRQWNTMKSILRTLVAQGYLMTSLTVNARGHEVRAYEPAGDAR